jgi:hypothetical protein
MNTTPYIVIPALLALLLPLGCSDKDPPRSKAIESAASIEPMLTATAPKPPKTVDPPSKKAETSVAKVVDVVKEEPVEPSVPDIEEKPSFVPELQPADGLSILRLVTAPAVEHREPVAASPIFGGEKVYAFVEAQNESEEDQVLVVYFIGPNGFASGGIELEVPSKTPRWRTWAFTKHATEPGLWRVEVRNLKGDLVGALRFEVEHGC